MRRIPLFAFLALAIAAPFGGTQVPPPPKLNPSPAPFPRGAQRTPFSKIIEAVKSGNAGIYRATTPPPQVIVVPKRLSYWGNNQYGDCVTAESVFAIAAYSTFLGMDEIFVTDATTINWAQSHGWANGAALLDVIQDMQRDGIKDEKGTVRKAGKPSSVDFSNEDTLKSALAQGPVSIAIDANALPSGAGNKSGWYAFGGRSYPNTDHCVSLSGYGATADLFKALNVTAPANAPTNGYLLFTWSTIGVVDHQWVMNTVVEAWVRNPTTTDLIPPPPPVPPPATVTVSVPNVAGSVGSPVKFAPTASGGTSPYVFLFDYGDAAQDAAGQHTYKANGTYTVKVTAVDSRGQLGTATCTAAIGTSPTPPPGPTPVGAGNISWTINGVMSQYELMPLGTRDAIKKVQDLIGPMAP